VVATMKITETIERECCQRKHMLFFVGLHQTCDAKHFGRCMISVNRLRDRKSNFEVGDWMMDSGAFSEITKFGDFRTSIAEYACEIRRWAKCGRMLVAVSQDYMCEPFALAQTGLTVPEHQRLTIGRYLSIASLVGNAAYVMPVLQGFWPEEYVAHVRQYGSILREGQWVGVGSVCKRNAEPEAIEAILWAIRQDRADLRLHGFGVKTTALASANIRAWLYSADSMAWSFSARKQGRNGNDWREAQEFVRRIEHQPAVRSDFQPVMF